MAALSQGCKHGIAEGGGVALLDGMGVDEKNAHRVLPPSLSHRLCAGRFQIATCSSRANPVFHAGERHSIRCHGYHGSSWELAALVAGLAQG